MKQMKHIVQFSGGKDSTAMLLMMLEKGMKVDEIIFCDTGKEFPEMYEHINKVEDYIQQNYGLTITKLHPEKPFEYWLLQHVKTKGNWQHTKGFGWATSRMRWCTKEMKVNVTSKHLKKYKEPYTLYIGIAADESERHEKKGDNVIHPLFDWGITEKQALEYCYSKGFDWGGTYEIFRRVSCWCCPLQRIGDLRTLRKHYPALWQELRELDKKVEGCQFKEHWTVQDLEIRFQFEEERLKQGLSITNRDFHTKLKEKILKSV